MDYISEEQWAVLRSTVNGVIATVNDGLQALVQIPGAGVVRKYIQNSYRNDPWRLFLEVVLVLILLNYLFRRRFRPKDKSVKLTRKVRPAAPTPRPRPRAVALTRARVARGCPGLPWLQEVDELVREWEPKPLAPPVSAVAKRDIEELPVVTKCV